MPTYDTSYPPSLWQPAPPPAATGATAGIPGTFTPAGCVIPANLSAMTGIVATPSTPWTAGQFVQTQLIGAPGRVTWSGAGWVGGVAPGLKTPAPEPAPTPAPPDPEPEPETPSS